MMFSILVVLISVLEQESMPVERPRYDLLHTEARKLGNGLNDIAYFVSVERFLRDTEVEDVLCAVVLREKPQNAGRLTISIYHQLERYLPSVVLPNAKQRQSQIAVYIWNGSLQRFQNRLLLLKDGHGTSFSPAVARDFDHTQCHQASPIDNKR